MALTVLINSSLGPYINLSTGPAVTSFLLTNTKEVSFILPIEIVKHNMVSSLYYSLVRCPKLGYTHDKWSREVTESMEVYSINGNTRI